MVRKRNIDADLLKQAILNMPIVVSGGQGLGSYSSQPIDALVEAKISAMLQTSLQGFKYQLVDMIERSAMLHSACVLCANKEGECEPPTI